MSKYDFAGAKTVRYASCNREIIEPHYDVMEKMDQHLLWESCVGKSTYYASRAFFNDTNFALNFANMLRRRRSIHGRIENVIANLFEFIVHKYCLDCESGSSVDTDNALEKVS